MKIGSNNSLTYLEPSSWWFKIFKWFYRHQELPCDVQYTLWGVRMFDFRLYADKHNHIAAKNGKCIYPLSTLYETLDYFNKREDVVVLITLDSSLDEYVKSPDTPSIEAKFKNTCKVLETIYKHIGFCGGYRKFDKKVLYKFDWEKYNGMPAIISPSRWSSFYRFVVNWCPFLIKKFNNLYINRYNWNEGYLMLDYVNKR